MATTPELHEAQITTAREKAWFQAGNPLLTLEAARTFVEEHGLVLFSPRPLGAPAPSLVEATLGTAKSSATATDADVARGLVARMVAEGSALPLNLLGGPGEMPDFIVAASAFPFVFTLRGDKGWKRAPETSGAVKVTPLALRVYELLAERGAMTVAAMVPEIGREVTDSAISRALSELWSLLRVIPALQPGEGQTTWELTTTRFIKAVKAGANAGQPTALSALISLYLGQAYIATEEEIASFLSPLTARSRVRDVLHGLTAGRQLNEAVLEGKSVLYIPDSLPDFATLTAAAEEDGFEELDETEDLDVEETGDEELGEGAEATPELSEGAEEGGAEEGDGEGRITRFDAGAEGATRAKGLRGKPISREGAAPRPRPASDRAARTARAAEPASDRPKRSFSDRGERAAGSDRPARSADGERRPRPASDRPSFTKPWEENRNRAPREGGAQDRPARAPRSDDSRPPRREGAEGRPFRPARPAGGGRPPFRREGGSDRPSFRPEGGGGRPPFRREGGSDRPPFRPEGGGGRPPFRREGGSDRPPFRPEGGGGRPPFRREGGSDRPPFRPEGGGGRPPFRREGGSDRPPFRPEGGGGRPPFRREGGSDRPPFRPEGGGGRPPFRREGGSDRPPFRPEGGGGRPPFRREGGSDRPPFRPEGGGGRPPFRREGGSDRPRPSFGARSEGRPSGGPARSGGFGAGRPSAGGPGRGPGGRPPFRSGGGDARPSGGFSRGPSRGGDRGPANGAPRRRPEDEA
ncbi:MAG: hypothetical protein ACRYFU_07050 [Janthinobacterium lividum]